MPHGIYHEGYNLDSALLYGGSHPHLADAHEVFGGAAYGLEDNGFGQPTKAPTTQSVKNMGRGASESGEPNIELSVAPRGKEYEHGNLAPTDVFKTGPTDPDTFASSAEKTRAEEFVGGGIEAGVDPSMVRMENMAKKAHFGGY